MSVGDAHGYWGAHGSINIQWVESNLAWTYFFWSNGCAVGNLDYSDNFISAILYSPTSLVLVAKGTTNNSGGMGNNQNGFFGHNIATALSQGKNFGEAILDHVNEPLIQPWSSNREMHFGTSIIIGDPTQNPAINQDSNNSVNLVCWEFDSSSVSCILFPGMIRQQFSINGKTEAFVLAMWLV